MTYVPEIEYPTGMYSISDLGGSVTIELPNPSVDSGKATYSTMVNSGRNASAVVTAQKIGRDQNKVEMAWQYLNKEIWEEIQGFFEENFFFNLEFYSSAFASKITRKCYVNDRTEQPFAVDSNGIPLAYKNCAFNCIDTGEGS